ncbi:hypothetical protein PHMEG_00027554 [Phytophthora megakarya]|uniref:Retrotransposon gag domain-containing protein n=1 Tax=Phytophthora megakarya TaxID=4795 RepID=A0A225V6X3_9STRA|nr:hypothetical protein PHMEG_00027554 [Phytophthora megakarya]
MRTQELLERVIEQMQQFSNQSYATMMEHSEQFQTLRSNMDLMSAELQNQRTGLAELRASVASVPQPAGGADVVESAELYPEWDVLGNMPPNTPVYTFDELESRIEKSFKQKETPIFGGEDEEDIDVYVRNMMLWYAAFGLFFRRPQVDFRVGQLMMNHTQGKAKAWLLQEYSGEWRWSSIAKKCDNGRLFDCTQGSRSLDKYIEEFVRLSRTEEVSVNFKMIFLKRVSSHKTYEIFSKRNLLQSWVDL